MHFRLWIYWKNFLNNLRDSRVSIFLKRVLVAIITFPLKGKVMCIKKCVNNRTLNGRLFEMDEPIIINFN